MTQYICFSIICNINLNKEFFVHIANHNNNGIDVTHRETPVRTEIRRGRYVLVCAATASQRCTHQRSLFGARSDLYCYILCLYTVFTGV